MLPAQQTVQLSQTVKKSLLATVAQIFIDDRRTKPFSDMIECMLGGVTTTSTIAVMYMYSRW